MLFKWVRPTKVLYPHIWLRFKAKDLYSMNMVEYTVQDLPEDRFDKDIEIMAKNFLAEAPLSKSTDAAHDPVYVEDMIRIWKRIVEQRMVQVCMKKDSKEIVGVNMSYVSSKGDPFFDSIIKSDKFLQNLRVYTILQEHGNFNVFDKYGVDKYVTSFGMYVPKKFAGRKIGEKLMEASKYLVKSCDSDIHLRHGFFTSNISNRIADNLGYTVDVELSFDEIRRIDPKLQFANVENSKVTLRTWSFDNEVR